jgi:hypothetical protein
LTGTGLGRLTGSLAALDLIGKNSAMVVALSTRQPAHCAASESMSRRRSFWRNTLE